MKRLFRTAMALSPWLSLAEPLFLVLILQGLHYLSPGLFCKAVNPGGKEFICGAGYTHPGVELLQTLGLSVWVLLLGTGGVEVFRGKATWRAVIAWSVSMLLFVGLAMLWLTLPVGDCP